MLPEGFDQGRKRLAITKKGGNILKNNTGFGKIWNISDKLEKIH
jgi:hypothetical protein